MSSYVVQVGDDWNLISRKVYGDTSQAARLASANPGVVEPLSPLTTIFTPPSLAKTLPTVFLPSSKNENEVTVLIDGQRFRHWDSVTILDQIDSISGASFTSTADVLNSDFRDAFKPFSYAPIEIYVGSIQRFAGTMVLPSTRVDENAVTVSVQCYGTAGNIMDCTAPTSAFPVEFNDVNLLDMARVLCAPFGLQVETEVDPGPTFDRVALSAGTKIFDFLSDLGKQRNIIWRSTPNGRLLATRAVDVGNPFAVLNEGEVPLTDVAQAFDAQNYYSHITGLRPALVASNGEAYTIRNTRMEGVLRPFVYTAQDTEEGTLQKAVENKTGLMFGNAVRYTITLSSWRSPEGELWRPNTTIKLNAPRAFVVKPYEFLVQSVNLTRKPASEVAQLVLVLPGSYSGEVPRSFPWD